MKISENKMLMAYALGRVSCVNGESKRFKLGTINPEWNNYELTGRGYEKSNDSYGLYYSGDLKETFGKEKFYFRILTVPEGWDLRHMTAMFISAIDMHKAFMKNK